MVTIARELGQRVQAGMREIIVGGDELTFALLVALLARGHALIQGVPGTGKTLAVRALAALLGAQYRRIQFTPDLMPADVVGTTVFNPQSAEFSMRPGPIVTNFLLADEINRTPPKTQSALLEAMEEGRVTIDGVPLQLPRPFFVCATQNPIEYEGTYPLPEAQLDRFLVMATAGYPAAAAELELLSRVAAGFDARAIEPQALKSIASPDEIIAAQGEVRGVRVAAPVQQYIYDLIAATRSHRGLSLGASPRAGVSLLAAAQASAAIDGRDYATPDDVKDVAPTVLPHRLIVAPQAEIDGVTSAKVVREILESVAIPREDAT
jgi:MoxR-like ATPase